MAHALSRSLFVCVVMFAAGLSPFAAAYEGGRREEVDGGTHVPTLTRAPELLSQVEAVYPPAAAQEGRTATVKLLITIAADGTVPEAVVVAAAGHGFDEAALEAVKQFRFRPAEVDGAPAPIQVEYAYHFQLRARPPEVAPPPALATLTGEVISRGSRGRVAAATVRCGDDPASPEALTGQDGRFTLEVPAGECRVKVFADGFVLFETQEVLAAGERTQVNYYLVPKSVGFETVVRAAREKKEVVRRTLERQELQKIPGSFGDPVRILQNFPGVARAPFVSGALIVRGAQPDQTLTFMDGVEIPLLYHLGGGPSVVNPEFLDRIDFFPGGFGGRYGRAVGGIVDVATRKGASDTLHGVAKVDLLDTSLFVETPLGEGLSIAGAARRSYVDALIPLVLPRNPEGGTLLVLPRYWDYQLRFDAGRKSSDERPAQSTYSVMAFGSDDVLQVVASGSGVNRDLSLNVHTLFHRVKGDWSYRSERFSSVLTPYIGYDLGSGAFGTTTFRADIWNVGLREDAQLDLGRHVTLRAGADVLFEHWQGRAELPVVGGSQYVAFPGAEPEAELQSVTRTFNAFDGAFYLETDLKAGALTVTPGVRASRARLHGHPLWSVEPRLWARYRVSEGTGVKGSVGLYSQPPEPQELDVPPFGTPTLQHERAFQTSVGVEQRLTDAINVDLTVFYNKRYANIVSPGPTLEQPNGAILRERFANDGVGRAYGLEVLLRHEVTRRFFGWLAYTLNRSEATRVGDSPYRLTSFDQTQILTAVGSYRLPAGFELGARFRYVTGRPRTPIVHPHDLYNADSNRYSATFGEPSSSRFRPFHQLDVRLDKSFLFQSWTLGVYVDVQNIYNAQNIEATLPDYRFREEIEVPGVPLLPVLGVRGSF